MEIGRMMELADGRVGLNIRRIHKLITLRYSTAYSERTNTYFLFLTLN